MKEEAQKDAEAKAGYVSPSKKKSVVIFWYSVDAINLFCPDKPEDTDVFYEVYVCILLFKKPLETADGWLKGAETGMLEADA